MMKFQKNKGVASFFLAVAMMFVTIGNIAEPVMVYAEDEVAYLGKSYSLKEKGEWKYIVTGNNAVIMGYTGTAPAVTVPSELDGRPVAAIGKNQNYRGKGAFEDNNSMQTVTVPSSVTYIDESAFRNCSGLQQVLISDGVTEIGKNAFADCSYMQRIQFKGSALKTIGASAFEKCAALDNLTIPESVTTIGDLAFADCTALSYIKIPDSVTSLGGGCFMNCKVLAEAVIGNGVKEITSAQGNYVSSGCDNYKHGCFELCSVLRKVTIGSGVKTISEDAFANSGLEELVIPDNVTEIGEYAFGDNTSLKSVVIGDGLKIIGNCAFVNDTALESVAFGENIRTIGEKAFRSNSSLKEVLIPSSVTELGGCFANCTLLRKAVIGNGVQSLGEASDNYDSNSNAENYKIGVFEHCTSLSEVALGDGITRIGVDAFADTALQEVTIPDNVVTIDNGAFMNCKELRSIKVGNGVTSMGKYVLANNTNLIDVQLGKGIVSIGEFALQKCTALERLMIPSSVTSLGAGLCAGCTSLKTVIIGNGVTELNEGGEDWGDFSDRHAENYRAGTFEHCTELQDVSLGSGLTKIGKDAFAGTKLVSLLIPEKVSEVQNGAFYTDSLQKLYFTGAAPTLGGIFDKTTPLLYKIAGKSGYEATDYTFQNFSPITVRFDLNGDVFAIEPIPQRMTPEGGYVIEPIEPVAEGHRFLGWYQDSACTVLWNFLENKVTEDTTLYAKWVKLSEAVPEAPKALVQESVTDSSAVLSWQAVEGATGYQVYVDGVLVTETPITACTYQLTGLEADSTYEVTVVALNENGASERSLVKIVQTNEKIPYRMGDVNKDESVNSSDALAVLKHDVGLELLAEDILANADVNADGLINSADALDILKMDVGIIAHFKAEEK